MKIAVSSYSFAHFLEATGETYTNIADRAKKMGFDGIEFIDLSTDIQPAESIEVLAKHIGEFCRSIELPIVAYTVQADFLKGDMNAEVERLKKAADIAKLLGAPLMRHDATWKREGNWKEVIDSIADAVREVSVYAESIGVKTCTENHGFFIQDSERVKYLMDKVGYKNYGWLVDMGNFACADENSADAVKTAIPYAFHIHIKDFIIKSPNCPAPTGNSWFKTRSGAYIRGTVPGDGVIPIKECLEIIKAYGYDGWISYEFEGAEDNISALENGLKFIKSCL